MAAKATKCFGHPTRLGDPPHKGWFAIPNVRFVRAWRGRGCRSSAAPRSVIPRPGHPSGRARRGATLSTSHVADVHARGSYTEAGVFVCFEGGEGSGKSTQSRALKEWLESEGFPVLLTFEPGDTEVGRKIRQIVLDPATGDLSDRTESLLYAADKAEHVETVVLPTLERGEVVITDRYVDSTLAYQGAGRSLDVAELEDIARWATRDLRPHLTVLLDLEPADGLGRFEDRDRIEGESPEFHERVREAFLGLAADNPEHYLVLDARKPVEEIAATIRDRVRPLLGQARRGDR
jgi:dTMP kinase